MEFSNSVYDWMSDINQWGEFFPCESSIIISSTESADELEPPIDTSEEDNDIYFDEDNNDYAEMNVSAIEDILGIALVPETELPIYLHNHSLLPILTHQPLLHYTQAPLLQNIHLLQNHSRFTFPIAALPSFAFLK